MGYLSFYKTCTQQSGHVNNIECKGKRITLIKPSNLWRNRFHAKSDWGRL